MTTTDLPRTGVVVLNWNGREHLERLLPQLTASEHPDLFVVVADNGSTDGTLDWVRSAHPQVLAVDNQRNLRFAGGNNVGAEVARSNGAEVIVILNNDTEVEPDSMARLSQVFVDARVGVAGPRICYLKNRDRIWYGGGIAHLAWGRLGHRALRRSVHAEADPMGPTGWVTGCALAVRASLWHELGGLDESFYIYGEDVDFCLRARRRGWAIQYQPDAVVYHAVSASVGGHAAPFKAYHQTRSRWTLLRRHAPVWQWPLAMLSMGAQDLAAAALALGRGQGRTSVARIRGAWSSWGGPTPAYPASELAEDK